MTILLEVLQWTIAAILIPIAVWILLQVTKLLLQVTIIVLKALMTLSIEITKLAFSIIIDLLRLGVKSLA